MGFFTSIPSINDPQLPTYISQKFEILKIKINNFITNGITINVLLPLINGIFLGIGEILARDIYTQYISSTVVKRRISKY